MEMCKVRLYIETGVVIIELQCLWEVDTVYLEMTSEWRL